VLPGAPVEDFQAHPMPFQRSTQGFRQRNGSMARAGYSRAVEILCCFQGAPGGSMGLGGIDVRSLIRESASCRVTASPRSFRASFWRLSQGSEAGKGFA
jgi:hypothetical protein